MKKIQYLFCLLFLLGSFPSFAQKSQPIKEITAIKMTPELVKEYIGKLSFQSFKMDRQGIMRPNKGYEIVYLEKTKQVVIKKKNTPIPIEGFDMQKVPGGMMYCFCGESGGGADDCEIKVTVHDNSLNYFCQGRCGCLDLMIYDVSKPIKEYETPGGRWFGF